MRVTFLLVAGLLCAHVAWVRTGAAQGATRDHSPQSRAQAPAGYADAIARALDEFDRGNFPEARAAFLQAHTQWPNARTLRGLANTEFELRNYRACIDYVQRALASDVRPLRGALRRDAQALLAAAQAYVATYRIHLDPADAELRVDGTRVDLEAAPDGTRLLTLEVGDHVLQASHPDHFDERQQLSVVGTDGTVKLTLRPRTATDGTPATPATPAEASVSAVPTVPATPAASDVSAEPVPAGATDAAPRPRDDADSLWASPWLWTAVGAGLATAVVVTLLVAGGEDTTAEPTGAQDNPWGKVAASPVAQVRF